jgi:hypothetical protein
MFHLRINPAFSDSHGALDRTDDQESLALAAFDGVQQRCFTLPTLDKWPELRLLLPRRLSPVVAAASTKPGV